MEEEFIRLSKLLSQKGICSRREADSYIEKGWVYVEGKCVNVLGTKVSPSSSITLKQELENLKDSKVTILLNKPLGYVSCLPEKGYEPAITLITSENQFSSKSSQTFLPSHLEKLSVAGRLDINSKGLLVFTQCGAIAKQLIGEDSGVEKEYFVRVSDYLTKEDCQLLEHGLELDGKPLKRAKVKKLSETTFTIILKEGKKRQIRRMCELLRLTALELKRIRIGNIELGNLPLGCWRFLRSDESFI
jgi:23S rRNA pseudouridine2604 synthase